jgi:hypothetical protein
MSENYKGKIPTAVARVAPHGDPNPRQRRRILIEICQRRIKPGNYTSPDFFKRRTAVHSWPQLFTIFKDIPWAITGGVATRAFMPERSTQDIDIVIPREDCGRAWAAFRDAGFHVAPALDAPYFVARSPEIPEVDVICVDFPWLETALANPHIDKAGMPVLDLPYLIIMKLMANRGVDIGDMTRMLGLSSDDDLDRVRAAVRAYASEDLDDLEALILLGRMEFKDQRK